MLLLVFPGSRWHGGTVVGFKMMIDYLAALGGYPTNYPPSDSSDSGEVGDGMTSGGTSGTS